MLIKKVVQPTGLKGMNDREWVGKRKKIEWGQNFVVLTANKKIPPGSSGRDLIMWRNQICYPR
jgi:hypothetical protein